MKEFVYHHISCRKSLPPQLATSAHVSYKRVPNFLAVVSSHVAGWSSRLSHLIEVWRREAGTVQPIRVFQGLANYFLPASNFCDSRASFVDRTRQYGAGKSSP